MLALGHRLFEIGSVSMEEGQRDLPGVVMGVDPVGHRPVAAWRRLVAVDAHVERDDLALRRTGNARTAAAVDDGVRQYKQKVAGAGGAITEIGDDDLFDQRADLRSDAGKRGDRDKQRIEDGRTHDVSLCRDGYSARLTAPSIHAICAAASEDAAQ
jgi:hypothetical protein